MHERERHKLILNAVQERPVATLGELVEMTGTSEATIRRDISALHLQGRLRRVRGGAEALHPPQFVGIAGRPFKVSETVNIERSEEHTSELQSQSNLVCRLLLEKKKI